VSRKAGSAAATLFHPQSLEVSGARAFHSFSSKTLNFRGPRARNFGGWKGESQSSATRAMQLPFAVSHLQTARIVVPSVVPKRVFVNNCKSMAF
jgi:hypothetical protein